MTASEAISYIENRGWSTTRLGLGRTRELLSLLGDPQKHLRFIHVAGSNGKGSVCAMFDSILRNAGYRCGLYTSPYIEDFCERIRINGENIPGERLARITDRVRKLAEKMEDHPSQFELVTAIAMEYFMEEGCDIVVLEVGMGGELDSTNAIDAPVLACITNIGLEHTEYLGNTIQEIAHTKSGIIKPGCRCVCYDGNHEATEVVRGVCAERGVPFTYTEFGRLTALSETLDGQRFLWKNRAGEQESFDLALIGKHQLHNAALVLTGVEVLQEEGWKIRKEDIRKGLSGVLWPARFEVLQKDPVVILDGGHNPQCAQALTESLKSLFPEQKVVFLAGVLADKDYEEILDQMAPYAARFVCVTPVSGRALPGKQLAEQVRKRGIPACSREQIEDGIVTALEQTEGKDPLVIFGSLYLAGAVRKAFPAAWRSYLRRKGIRARDALTVQERERRSAAICSQMLSSQEYRAARTILVYNAVRGEVNMDLLIRQAEADGRRIAYPRCTDRKHFSAMIPEDAESFSAGLFHIPEPMAERSVLVNPEEIDLVLCPGTVFDEQGNRLGMGSGYYDRFLTGCTNARVFGAAFACQIVKDIPKNEWDHPMDKVFTEQRVIVPSKL